MRPINWIQYLSLLSIIAMAITLPFTAYRLSQVSRHQSDAIRTVICFSESRITTSTKLTLKQKRDAVKFYNGALASIHVKPCKESA